MLRRRIAILLLLALVFLMATPLPVSAGHWRVHVLIAYDEEWQSIANSVYAYSPRELAQVLMYVVAGRFWETFNIKFYVMGYVFWDSDDNPGGPHAMLFEAMEEADFESGMWLGGYVMHIFVAFTGQDIPFVFGFANSTLGIVLVEHTCVSGVGQATDNVLQHELSHLYAAVDEWTYGLMCVMNYAPRYIGFPYFKYVRTALIAENWCADCSATIMNHADNWGYWDTGGGGGNGRIEFIAWGDEAVKES